MKKCFYLTQFSKLKRIGFSHADSSKILQGIPKETTMFQSSFSNPTEIKPVTVNQKVIPFLQAIHFENFVREHFANYFDYVLELIKRIDLQLIDRDK